MCSVFSKQFCYLASNFLLQFSDTGTIDAGLCSMNSWRLSDCEHTPFGFHNLWIVRSIHYANLSKTLHQVGKYTIQEYAFEQNGQNASPKAQILDKTVHIVLSTLGKYDENVRKWMKMWQIPKNSISENHVILQYFWTTLTNRGLWAKISKYAQIVPKYSL